MSVTVNVDLHCDRCDDHLSDGSGVYCHNCYAVADGGRMTLANRLNVLRYDLVLLKAGPEADKLAERLYDIIETIK